MSRSFGNSYPSTVQSSSSSSRMSVAPGTEWEDLRKQARQHENEIDAKLMSFSKLCSNYVAHDQNDTSSTTSTSSFETMSIEIEKLLERLSDVNKRMTDAIPTLLGPNTAATHTLQRHHEICQDYRREFERTKSNIRNFKTREDLLMNNNNNNSDMNSTGLSSRRQDYYLREMGHITNSNKLMDRNLEMASMLKKDLADQRKYFMNITHKVKTIANRFPLMNNILQKIKIKKRKDSLVLGFVIALCLIILILYMFR
jgi:golgi SNAP receptor complex member 1